MMTRKSVLLVVVLMTLVTGACDRGEQTETTSPGKIAAGGILLPRQLLGLEVKSEDVSKEFEGIKRAYIENLGLFSLRESDLVRATLQVSEFNRLAEPKDPVFRNSIISRLGARRPEVIIVSGTTVYLTSGSDQSIFAWFEDRGFFVLTAHQEYEFPRTLLRRVIETKEKL